MSAETEKLCPACFQSTIVDGKCRACGYILPPLASEGGKLPPFSVLNARYLLGKDLGQGGFGITYLAQDQQTGENCCIKEYYPSNLVRGRDDHGGLLLDSEASKTEFDQGKQQFIEEASTLKELRGNVTVVNIEDYFEQNGTAYFVMELLEGCNLRAFQRTHSPEQNFRMALQMLLLVGSALIEVHRFGMIHGDISPENILITQHGELKLIDFGAARSFVHRGQNNERKIYLKPNYAPYEQYTLRPCQGPWTDLYALASTFYFIVSNKKMIDAPSRAKGASYTPLCELSPYVSRELSKVIDRALAFDYHDRFQTIPEFLKELEPMIRPEDLSLDLEALMPHTASEALQASPLSAEESKKLCSVEQQEPRSAWSLTSLFWHKKQNQMAFLELTLHSKATRRWNIPANRVIRIGRLASSDVMMPSVNRISRTHCELLYNDKQKDFTIRDRSKFGTLLSNGHRMEHGKSYTLHDGDRFYILSSEYQFRVVIEK